MAELKLISPLQYVKGVGPRRASALGKQGIETVADLLNYYPRNYLDRTNVIDISALQVDREATIVGEVKAHGILYGKRKRYEVILSDKTGSIALLFFAGVRYWERLFKKGQIFAATGLVSYFQSRQIIHPDMERLDDGADRMVHAGRIIPVYRQTSELSKVGLSSKGLRTLTTYIIENLKDKYSDYLPEKIRKENKLIGLHQAVVKTHYPESREEVEQCRRRLAFDELLQLQFLVYLSKGRKSQLTKTHKYSNPGQKITEFKKKLGFELTAAQKKVVDEIINSMQKPNPMSRLVHGDVGCGKTAVAVIAALYAAENKLQVAFMAPTEILANQHFRNWSEKLKQLEIRSELLTASIPVAKKKKIIKECAAGEVDILFGTHALIYDSVSFDKLGLIIIDEQHRFGVEQRGKLYAKGKNPDLLVMTATPIPRTLALTLYGDLDISTIDSLPPGRSPIRTVWRGSDSREKILKYVHDELINGAQGYMVYPLIEKSDQLDLGNVEDAFLELSEGPFKDLQLGVIHGRVKPKDRDIILKQFRDREIDLLLATTVIEVGIDNPNATILVVEHAERFGLAQLHQLRGRIGRGEKNSTAIALAYPPISPVARQRLNYLAETTDGFQIAEADLELRGPGEIFGLRQSGLPEMKVANLWRDRDLMENGRKLLKSINDLEASLDNDMKGMLEYLKGSADRQAMHLGGG